MRTNRTLALGGGALILALGGASFLRGPDTSGGQGALARVASLRAGMTMRQTASALRPHRMGSGYLLCRTRPLSSGRLGMTHGLTRDRHLEMIWTGTTKPEATLVSWELRSGPAPREDIVTDRAVQIGGFVVRY